MWIKARYFLKEKMHIPKGEKYLSESSRGGTKGEIIVLGEAKPSLDGGKHPSKCKWFQLVSIDIK